MRSWCRILPVFVVVWFARRRLDTVPIYRPPGVETTHVHIPWPDVWIRADGGPEWHRNRKRKWPRIRITWE